MKNNRKTGMQLDPSTGDLLLSGNSLYVGNTLYQNQFLLLRIQRGELKNDPMVGYGIDSDLGDDAGDTMQQKRLREQLAMDGLVPRQLKIKNGMITLVADYV